MSTYRQAIFMILDELKLLSDDANFTEDHIAYLLDKYRAFLLKQRYSDIKKQMPEANYQTICLTLTEVPAISGEPCEGGSYLRTTVTIPYLIQIGHPRVYPIDYYQGEISLVSRDRMRYIGYNKYLKNIIYCSIGPDGYLYFKSSNPQFLYLENIKMTGIFQDALAASELACTIVCDYEDRVFPLEDPLIPVVIDLVVKELAGPVYAPKDNENDAEDNLSNTQVLRRK